MNVRGVKGNGLVIAIAVALGGLSAADALAAQTNVTTKGKVSVYTVPAAAQAAAAIDIANARALPTPTVDMPALGPMEGGTATASLDQPDYRPGAPGDGKTAPVKLPAQNVNALDDILAAGDGGMASQEYGTAYHPYTTMRVDLVGNNESKAWPYRAAGKLYFNIGADTYVCSGSLIKRGLVVTAAHCVASFGQRRFYSNWKFIPAQYDNVAPYGAWTAASASVLTSYYNGTDPCSVQGVVCTNDVAVIRLNAQSGKFPGTSTGWFGYGWDGYGFTPNNLALINQLGYPASHDSGLRMQRTDSQGYVSASYSNNTIWGGRQTGGSSGGPELVNLGILPNRSSEAPLGYEADANVVVGVTSWGYASITTKQQGASPFTSGNIVPLVSAACAGQTACQ